MTVLKNKLVIISGFALLAVSIILVYVYKTSDNRPFFPKIVIVFEGDGVEKLTFYYDDDGKQLDISNKYHAGLKISGCNQVRDMCVGMPGRRRYVFGTSRLQKIQIMRVGGSNPVIGVVSWTGVPYPEEVRLKCNLEVQDPSKSCSVVSTVPE